MHRTRLLTGIVLIATATAAVVFALRTAVGDQARAQAALLAAASQATATRDADERRATEGRVSAAAELQPLESAIRDRVDGTTLLISCSMSSRTLPLALTRGATCRMMPVLR